MAYDFLNTGRCRTEVSIHWSHSGHVLPTITWTHRTKRHEKCLRDGLVGRARMGWKT